MATNPPITIGIFNNVPAPGSGIQSAWAQQISRVVGLRTGGTWRRGTSQSIPNNASTHIVWDTEDADTGGFLTPPSNAVVIPTGMGGLYAVTAEATWASTALSLNSLQITVSGITDPYQFTGNTHDGLIAASAVVPIAAGAVITVQALQTSGGAVGIARARLDLYRIGV